MKYRRYLAKCESKEKKKNLSTIQLLPLWVKDLFYLGTGVGTIFVVETLGIQYLSKDIVTICFVWSYVAVMAVFAILQFFEILSINRSILIYIIVALIVPFLFFATLGYLLHPLYLQTMQFLP